MLPLNRFGQTKAQPRGGEDTEAARRPPARRPGVNEDGGGITDSPEPLMGLG